MANPFANTASKFSLPQFPLVTASVAASAHTTNGATDALALTLQDNTTSATARNLILRVRTRSVSAACTTGLTVTITDGTTTETVAIEPASAAGAAVEYVIPIITDLFVTTVTLTWALAGTIGTGITVDAEVFGN